MIEKRTQIRSRSKFLAALVANFRHLLLCMAYMLILRFTLAIINGDTAIVQNLMKFSMTPDIFHLTLAAKHGRVQIIRLLVEAGLDVQAGCLDTKYLGW